MPESISNSVKLTCAIITFNEEKNIGACIESVLGLADEILVVDSFSTDNTKKIVESFPKTRFVTNEFNGHIQQKNFALEISKGDFVLSLDADERIDEVLKESIRKELENPNLENCNGFKISRLTYHMGKPIRHGGWYPLYRYRLVRKGKAKWVGENPHDFIVIEGKSGKLKGDIIHYSFLDLSHQIDTINKFSSIVAFTRFQKKISFSVLKTIYKPIVKFLEIYIFKFGFLDGFPGFVIAASSAFSTFLKFSKLYELEKSYIERPSNVRTTYGN